MLDDDNSTTAGSPDEAGSESSVPTEAPAKKAAPRKSAAKKTTAKKAATRKSAAKKTAATPTTEPADPAAEGGEVVEAPAKKTAAKKTAAKKTAAKKTAAKKSTPRKTAVKQVAAPEAEPVDSSSAEAASAPAVLFQAPEATKAPVRRTRKTTQVKQVPAPDAASETVEPAASTTPADTTAGDVPAEGAAEGAAEASASPEEASEKKPKAARSTPKKSEQKKAGPKKSTKKAAGSDESAEGGAEDAGEEESDAGTEAPEAPEKPVKGQKKSKKDQTSPAAGETQELKADAADSEAADESDESGDADADASDGEGSGGPRRRRRRGGRRRRKSSDSDGNEHDSDSDQDADDREGKDSDDAADAEGGDGSGSRRRRRRRRAGDNNGGSGDDPENTVTRVRQGRSVEDQITAVTGSTRLEAKKQRRREGREAGRRRAPIVSEAEFLARRESVDRKMVIRQKKELTQIAVLEDKVLVEHYVARESQNSLIGNVYVGRVQNVLPSMEAAFVDIGKGRNAVIYAGEINWAGLGHKDGQPRKIESVLSSGQSILVQVTKDPIGHKGARLTGQVSLAGRFLVYVPDGTTSGISRKLPDTERSRLKAALKEIVPDSAGVIVRTAAEGASEDELTRDVERLKARWEDIEAKSKSGGSPKLLYGEPDLTLKVVRDLFTEDFSQLVIEGDEAWETVRDYVSHMAPDLEERMEKFESDNGTDSFAAHRIDEQIAKGVDRKVWLPSGGSLIIDRTEAMTVVDVNTGKFTGSGGNLEETVTKNNLEAAEEIVRQLRLRDIGGIIVVDFIDMVLESNRDLVLRRLVECLGRDRTRHQVAEVTSLGLVQMTRKRIGTGLLEAFSEDCEHCQGRGVVVHDMPIEPRKSDDGGGRATGGRRGRGRGKGDGSDGSNQSGSNQSGNNSGGRNSGQQSSPAAPSPKDVAAMAKAENADKPPVDEVPAHQVTKDQGSPETAAPAATPSETAPAASSSETAAPAAEVAPSGADEAPAVVRTTRRRSSRRGSGGAAQSAESSGTSAAAPVAPVTGSASRDADPAGARDVSEAGATHERSPEATDKGAEVAVEAPPASTGATTQVVTRTRRGASRRTGVSTPAPAVAITVSTPAAAPAQEQAEEPAAPKVVTTTRSRRGGTRRAATGAQAQAGSGGPAGAEGAAEQAAEPAPAELHVPVKKKGSRKR
ncbi:Rne/Rng family ribonuclease [Nocardioides sp. JQ2195]|uniref:ribonuclease E/G n=1 Tax=Nocardioides sp. JQ2195 TaxID=2592334 RepID=UPI00143E6999|nr:Rne/Rng family ribonuclease [Nocardioides sp. JQ2195]QIX26084.1 Rne/Rng family ribonuclease [Nocardioides sp. JQ2195]